MQSIRPNQGDAILDLVEQCRVVSAAWDQSETSKRNRGASAQGAQSKAVAEDSEQSYRKAIEELTDYYVEANNLGVDDSVLIGVLAKNLPSDIVCTLNLGPVDSAA